MVSMKPTIWDIIGLATAILSYQTSTLHSNTAVSQPLSQLKKTKCNSVYMHKFSGNPFLDRMGVGERGEWGEAYKALSLQRSWEVATRRRRLFDLAKGNTNGKMVVNRNCWYITHKKSLTLSTS